MEHEKEARAASRKLVQEVAVAFAERLERNDVIPLSGFDLSSEMHAAG